MSVENERNIYIEAQWGSALYLNHFFITVKIQQFYDLFTVSVIPKYDGLDWKV